MFDEINRKFYFCFIFLDFYFFVSCSKKQSCDETPHPLINDANKNSYYLIDTIICVRNSTDTLFFIKNPFTKIVEIIRACGTSCTYGGACPHYYECTTYTMNFLTLDKSQSIGIKRNYYKVNDWMDSGYDDEYDFKINSANFILPGTDPYSNPAIEDSLSVNKKIYRNVYRLFGYNTGYLYIFKNKMLRYIDVGKKDALDFLN